MTATSSEDTIFLLDASRSMFRQEFGEKSRLRIGVNAIKDIILNKKKIDQSDRYSVVSFNGSIKQLEEMSFNEIDVLNFIKNQSEFQQGTAFGEALAGALRIIVGELRKIGEKTIRILIISDGIPLISGMNALNISKIAKQLGVIIDVLRIGPAKVPGNILKRISQVTDGDYYFISDDDEYNNAIKEISKKKENNVSTIFDKNKNDANVSSELLSEIAGSLLKLEDLTPEQKFKIFGGNQNKTLKCSICYSNNCPTCETSFYGCGRFCPNCLTPLHMHCSIAWADNQNKKNGMSNGDYKIFRCVHCFYLLKIPVHNVAGSNGEGNNTGDKTATKMNIHNAPREVLSLACAHPECGIMFDENEDETIYKCNNCESYFHEDCFEEDHNKDHKCPNCHKVLTLK